MWHKLKNKLKEKKNEREEVVDSGGYQAYEGHQFSRWGHPLSISFFIFKVLNKLRHDIVCHVGQVNPPFKCGINGLT